MKPPMYPPPIPSKANWIAIQLMVAFLLLLWFLSGCGPRGEVPYACTDVPGAPCKCSEVPLFNPYDPSNPTCAKKEEAR